jgi:hypothetical protein
MMVVFAQVANSFFWISRSENYLLSGITPRSGQVARVASECGFN